MAKTDDDTRIPFTLRLPPDLHLKLIEAAELGNRSLNAEIIDRLERSVGVDRVAEEVEATMLDILRRAGLKDAANSVLERQAERRAQWPEEEKKLVKRQARGRAVIAGLRKPKG